MSLQVFLQAQLIGTAEFLSAETAPDGKGNDAFQGRLAWLNLFCEVLPRALLSELGLSRMLLGSTSAEQFLLVLPEEDIERANAFLRAAADGVAQLSSGTLRLVWASTEELGAWPVVRKRLDDALCAVRSAPLRQTAGEGVFAPIAAGVEGRDSAESYFSSFGIGFASASRVGFSRERPAELMWDSRELSWSLVEQSDPEKDSILLPRRLATNDEGQPLTLGELASRADGRKQWGILLGDVDQFESLLRQAGSVEDHIHLSLLFKEFFAGELAVLCALPEFWRKVTLLYRGGDDFAVLGSWDALLLLARELQRVFEKFAEQNLQSVSAPEGKTISMALAIASDVDEGMNSVFARAAKQLRQSKTIESGNFNLFGRTLEWKRLSDAEELKSNLVRLVSDFDYPAEYILDLASVYRETLSARSSRRKATRLEKPWRTYMRLARVIPQTRGKEVNNLRNSVITSLIGKRTAALKLRPSGRVGLEWARLATDKNS